MSKIQTPERGALGGFFMPKIKGSLEHFFAGDEGAIALAKDSITRFSDDLVNEVPKEGGYKMEKAGPTVAGKSFEDEQGSF